MRFRFLSIPCALLLLLSTAHAQQLDPLTTGSTYLVAFPDTLHHQSDPRQPWTMSDTLALLMFSDVANDVVVSNGPFRDTVHLAPRAMAEVYLNTDPGRAARGIVTTTNQPSSNIYRVDAASPIVLYAFMATSYGTEAWAPTPVETWGRDYTVLLPGSDIIRDITVDSAGMPSTTVRSAPSELCILTSADNTQITITPSSPKQQFEGTPPLTMTLPGNQVVQLQTLLALAPLDTARGLYYPVDLSGMSITASKPINILAAVTRKSMVDTLTPGITGNAFRSLLAEEVLPHEQLGRRFVYTPTWDDRRFLRVQEEDRSEKRQGELVRVINMGDTANLITMVEDGGKHIHGPIEPGRYFDWIVESPHPLVVSSDEPIAMISAPYGVGKGTAQAQPGDTSWESWASYLVTPTSLEQWSSFAPFYALANPQGMTHFINVVSRLSDRENIFDEMGNPLAGWDTIPGTDLCWTTHTFEPGVTHWIEGRNGARFHAQQYGLLSGREIIHRNGNAVEYEERLAASYGLALAPQRRDLAANPVAVDVNTASACDTLDVLLHITGDSAASLRSIRLDSATNARLELVPAPQPGDREVHVRVVAINRDNGATGSVTVIDRSGNITRVPYSWNPAGATLESQIDIAKRIGTSNDTTITIVNTGSTPMVITSASVVGSLTVTLTNLTLPASVPPSGQLVITVRFAPVAVGTVRDTILIDLPCLTLRVPVNGTGEATTGVRREAGGAVIAVAPNPSYDRTSITLQKLSGRTSVQIVDPQGRTVERLFNGRAQQQTMQFEWNTSSLPTGTYQVVVVTNGKRSIVPVIVAH